MWKAAYVLVAASFLATVATYYHPGVGFTAFIEFPAAAHDAELPALRATPHRDATSPGYDGQFYAQLALDPLVRDPAIDEALDNPPYRARRILFSWTAFALGLGRPWWVLQIYALQNAIAWLLGAWLLCRWMPPVDARRLVLWSGCLLSHGALSSVRYAMPDGPTTWLLMAGLAIEGPIASALIIGVAGLGRETALLGASRFVASLIARRWWLAGLCLLLCALPLAIWTDYLRSIYRDDVLAGGNHITTVVAGLAWKLSRIDSEAAVRGMTFPVIASGLAVTGLLVQAGIVLTALARSRARDRWALLGAAFVALALVTHQDVYAGTPGAFTRVLLPLTIAANVLLAGWPRAPWLLIAGANLGVVPGLLMFAMGW